MKVYCVVSKGQFGTYLRGVFASIKAAKIAWPFKWTKCNFKDNDKYKGKTILQAVEKATYPSQPAWELSTWYMSEFEVQGVESKVSDFAMAALGGDNSAIDLIKDILRL